MKKVLRITGIVVLSLVLVLLITGFVGYSRISNQVDSRYESLGPEASVINRDGLSFRDLNKNGKLDPYEDPRVSIEDRVNDLVSQMSLRKRREACLSP